MKLLIYDCNVSCGSGTPQAANEGKSTKLVDLGSVRFKANALPFKFRFGASRQNLVPRAFFTSIICRADRVSNEPIRAAIKKTVSVAEAGKVQFLQSDGLAANTRPGTCKSKHVFPLMRGETPSLPVMGRGGRWVKNINSEVCSVN